MVLFQAFHVGNSRSETISAFRKSPFSHRFLLIGTIGATLVHIAALHIGPMQFVLRVTPIALADWALMLVRSRSFSSWRSTSTCAEHYRGWELA